MVRCCTKGRGRTREFLVTSFFYHRKFCCCWMKKNDFFFVISLNWNRKSFKDEKMLNTTNEEIYWEETRRGCTQLIGLFSKNILFSLKALWTEASGEAKNKARFNVNLTKYEQALLSIDKYWSALNKGKCLSLIYFICFWIQSSYRHFSIMNIIIIIIIDENIKEAWNPHQSWNVFFVLRWRGINNKSNNAEFLSVE